MKVQLLILFICLIKVYSDESFIQTSNEQNINNVCEENSIFYTNHSAYWDGGIKIYDDADKNDTVFYVCLKSKINCSSGIKSTHIPEKGCIGADDFQDITFPSSKTYSIFVLRNNVHSLRENITYETFSSFSCEGCELNIYSEAMILFKVSNKTEVDFGEFFTESSSTTPQGGKVEISPSKENERKIDESGKKKERNEKIKERKKVFIILGVVAIVLLFLLAAAFIIYRLRTAKRTLNPETAKSTNEIPLSENEEESTHENSIPFRFVDNELYETNTWESKEYREIPEVVSTGVNRKEEINNDCPMDPGGPSHIEVNGDIYTVVNKEGEN